MRDDKVVDDQQLSEYSERRQLFLNAFAFFIPTLDISVLLLLLIRAEASSLIFLHLNTP